MALKTTAQLAEQSGYLRHQVARVCDQLEREGRLMLCRVCRVRLIPDEVVPMILAELKKRPGWAKRPPAEVA